jgi:hypothetical protein
MLVSARLRRTPEKDGREGRGKKGSARAWEKRKAGKTDVTA